MFERFKMLNRYIFLYKSMADLNDPQKFAMADIVTKNSKTGITSNKRLLVIKKGHLYYYSNVPKNYKNDISALDSYHEYPKCSIEIANIKKINELQKNSNYFSIQFEAKHMMERQDIRKTMTLEQFNFAPKNKKQLITWQFTCENQAVKQSWVQSLQSLKSHYGKQKINIEKFFENIKKKQQDKQVMSPAMRSSMNVPWKEDQFKKNGSNQNLRKTQLNLNRTTSSRSASPNTKKSVSSEDKNSPKEQRQAHNSSISSEELVQTFIKLQKTQSAVQPIINQIINQEEQFSQKQQQMQIAEKQIQNRVDFVKTYSQQQIVSNQQLVQMGMEKIQKKQTIDAQKIERPSTPQKQPLKNEQSINKQVVSQYQYDDNSILQSKAVPKVQQEQNNQFEYKFQPQETRKIISSSKKLDVSQQIRLFQETEPKIQKIFKPTTNQQIPKFKQDFDTNFYQLIYFCSNRQYPFEKRIGAQKKLNSIIGNFTQRSVKSFIQFVNSKNSNSKKFSQERLTQQNSNLNIGYIKYKVSYVSTQSITINGKQKVFYNEASIKELKRQMKIYNKLFSLIWNQIKYTSEFKPMNIQNTLEQSMSMSISKSNRSQNQGEQTVSSLSTLPPYIKEILTKVRVPLCTFVEYRGVCALSFDDSIKQEQIMDKQQHNSLRELIKYLGFDCNQFSFKKVSSQLGELVIVYIIQAKPSIYIDKKQEKHHNLSFESPMNIQFLKRAKKQGASMSTQSLLRYIKGIKQINDYSNFICPPSQILATLEYCYFCKYFRKFYRASHGEIDELKFINLLLRGDPNITKIFQSSGFQFQASKNSSSILGIFFQFLLYYLGLKCEIHPKQVTKFANLIPLGIKCTQKNDINFIKSIRKIPRVKGYSLNFIELYQSFQKINQFIANKQNQLCQKSFQLKQLTFFQNPFQQDCYPWPSQCQCLFNSAEINYMENDYISSINKSKEYLIAISPAAPNHSNHNSGTASHFHAQQQVWQQPTPSLCLPVYLLLLKAYSKFSRDRLHQLLKQALENTIFNFGEQSYTMITLLQFVGLVFFAVGDYLQADKFLHIAINIMEAKFNAIKQNKLVELYTDIAKVKGSKGQADQSVKYLQKARKIADNFCSNQQKIVFELENLNSVAKSIKNIQNEQKAMQLIYQIDKIINKTKVHLQVLKRYYQLVYLVSSKYSRWDICEKIIEQLWQLDTNSKISAIQKAYRVVMQRLSQSDGFSKIVINKQESSKQKLLLIIEQGLKTKNHRNILSLMQQILNQYAEEDEQQDVEIISAIVKLLPTGSTRFR